MLDKYQRQYIRFKFSSFLLFLRLKGKVSNSPETISVLLSAGGNSSFLFLFFPLNLKSINVFKEPSCQGVCSRSACD